MNSLFILGVMLLGINVAACIWILSSQRLVASRCNQCLQKLALNDVRHCEHCGADLLSCGIQAGVVMRVPPRASLVFLALAISFSVIPVAESIRNDFEVSALSNGPWSRSLEFKFKLSPPLIPNGEINLSLVKSCVFPGPFLSTTRGPLSNSLKYVLRSPDSSNVLPLAFAQDPFGYKNSIGPAALSSAEGELAQRIRLWLLESRTLPIGLEWARSVDVIADYFAGQNKAINSNGLIGDIDGIEYVTTVSAAEEVPLTKVFVASTYGAVLLLVLLVCGVLTTLVLVLTRPRELPV